MKRLVLSLLLTVVFAVPAFSQMDMPMKEHKDGHGQMMKMGDTMGMCIKHAGDMGLTDDQIMKMKSMHREMQRRQARFEADLKIARIDLMEIMEVKDFDLEKAGSAVRRIEQIKTARHLEMLKAMKEMRAGLTDEQFKKMRMMFMKMGEHKRAKNMMEKP